MSILTNPTLKSTERAFTLQKYLLLHSQHDALKKRIDASRESSACSSVSSPSSSAPTTRRSSISSSSPPTAQPFASPISPISEDECPYGREDGGVSPRSLSRGSSVMPSVPGAPQMQPQLHDRPHYYHQQHFGGGHGHGPTTSGAGHHHRSSSGRRSSLPSPALSPLLENGHATSAPISIPNAKAEDDELADDEMQLLHVNQQIKSTLTELLNCESVRGDRNYRMWVQTRLMDVEQELKTSRRESLDNGRRRSAEFTGVM